MLVLRQLQTEILLYVDKASQFVHTFNTAVCITLIQEKYDSCAAWLRPMNLIAWLVFNGTFSTKRHHAIGDMCVKTVVTG